jgi:hypothetical protein
MQILGTDKYTAWHVSETHTNYTHPHKTLTSFEIMTNVFLRETFGSGYARCTVDGNA